MFWFIEVCLLALFSHGGTGKGVFGDSLIRAQFYHKGSLVCSNHLPKSSLPNTITLGVRILADRFGGDTSIQSVADMNDTFIMGLRATRILCHPSLFSEGTWGRFMKAIPPRVLHIGGSIPPVKTVGATDFFQRDPAQCYALSTQVTA
jgi:hypothetical protein